MPYQNLFTPSKIGNVEIKNRVVMPPMMLGFGQFDGTPTEKMMDYYEERAIGTYARMAVIDIYEVVGKMARTDKGWVNTDNLL